MGNPEFLHVVACRQTLDGSRAFAAIEAWVRAAGIQPGTPLVRRITPKKPVSAKRLAAAFSGHSGHVGFVVAAKEARVADTAIQAITRHAGSAMIARYGQQTDQIRRAAHKLDGTVCPQAQAADDRRV